MPFVYRLPVVQITNFFWCTYLSFLEANKQERHGEEIAGIHVRRHTVFAVDRVARTIDGTEMRDVGIQTEPVTILPKLPFW